MESISGKLHQYETYINDVLKSDLKRVCDEMDRTTSELAEYNQLNATVCFLIECKEKDEPFKTMTDIGCDFYMQTRVDEISKILIEIGLGYYLELELNEAQRFIESKEKFLNAKLKALREKSAKVKAHIKLSLLYMNALYSGS